jgi:hypothetical protein
MKTGREVGTRSSHTRIVVVAALIAAASGHWLLAQDLEPRSYSNSPTGLNFVLLGYGYTTGSVLTDPALPIENVTNEAHIGIFAFAHVLNLFGQSAKFDCVLPFAGITAKGLVFGQPRTRQISGLGDPFFRFSINFLGAPALTAAEFKNYRQDLILGASLRVGVPLGQYDDTRLVNVGSNRWSIKPELGASKAFGRWTLEVAPAVTLYTDNDDFLSGKTRSQGPLYAVQGHVTYTFKPGFWLGVDAAYFNGGQSTIDGVKNSDRHEGARFGATLALPLNRYQSIKLYGTTGYNADRNHDFDAVGIAWQYRWGGGF